MSFPALNALGFNGGEDSHYFSDNPIDGAMRFETEGGLVITRKRFTRAAGRHIVTGFTEITVANKVLFDNFFVSQGGGAQSFTYIHPLTGEYLNVRFEGEYKTTYTGLGSDITWDITDIKLRSF